MNGERTGVKLAALILGGLVAALALSYVLLVVTNPGVEEHPFFETVAGSAARETAEAGNPGAGSESPRRPVRVIAHRGGVNLWPENTIYAFERALALGVDVLEMDVRGTADDRLVLLHDETVDRTTNGTGRIRDLTLAEVRELDAGYTWPDRIVTREREIAGESYEAPSGNAAPPDPAEEVPPAAEGLSPTGAAEGPTAEHPYRGRGIRIPTLEEVLAAFPNARMNMDLKETDPVLIRRFIEIMAEADRADRTLLASFHPETIEALREGLPDYPSSGVEPEIRPFVILSKLGLAAVYRPAAEAFQVPEYAGGLHVITRGLTRPANRLGIQVDAWSAGSWDGPIVRRQDMERLINAGVNGIITDRPDLLLEVLGRR